jgi:hypothetical protein
MQPVSDFLDAGRDVPTFFDRYRFAGFPLNWDRPVCPQVLRPQVLQVLLQPQRGIAERIDVLAAKTLPDIQRAVKWGMAYYGVDGGWCFSSGAFVGHVKLMFIRGTAIKPEPPVMPIGMGKSTRGVELASVDDIDERQLASWMKQAATMPYVGGKKR